MNDLFFISVGILFHIFAPAYFMERWEFEEAKRDV